MGKKNPRVLIVGIGFSGSDGGGITLTNLFSKFSKENLAVVLPFSSSPAEKSSQYASVYQLGGNELVINPFGLYNKKTNPDQPTSVTRSVGSSRVESGFGFFVRYIARILGLNHAYRQCRISSDLADFIDEFSPDVLYCQLARVDMIRLVKRITDKSGLPLVIHIMDDWPVTINRPNLLYLYWRKKIDQEFRQLINRSSLLLGISDEMCREYRKRYHRNFTAFHNPVDIQKWSGRTKHDLSVGKVCKIIYFGSLSIYTNQYSIEDFARAVDWMNRSGQKIEFDIYSFQSNAKVSKKFNKLRGVNLHKPFPYSDLTKIIPRYDLCLLPLNINKFTNKFAKLSISTKMAECMISGVPTIVYAGKETALYKTAKKDGWAFPVGERDQKSLKAAIGTLTNSLEIRKRISEKAVNFAIENFGIDQVSDAFKISISKIVKTRK